MPRFGDKSRKNYDLLTNATYGLAALEALVDDLESRLTAARALLLDNLDGKITDIEGTGFVKDTDSLVNIRGYVDALETRLTAARAGYLDNLNNANLLTIVNRAWKHNAVAVIDQASPVQNTWYPVLAATGDCRIMNVSFRIVTTAETIEVRFTMDGVTRTASLAATADTTYYIFPYLDSSNIIFSVSSMIRTRAEVFSGQSIAVAIRKTTASGTGNLRCVVDYDTQEAT